MTRPGDNAPQRTDAEVRHVTIVKCDVVGSTAIKRPLDLEGQLAFQDRFQQVVSDVVTRYGAHIEKFEGDGALILFGFPQPWEDAPESAVRLAMELRAVWEAAGGVNGEKINRHDMSIIREQIAPLMVTPEQAAADAENAEAS